MKIKKIRINVCILDLFYDSFIINNELHFSFFFFFVLLPTSKMSSMKFTRALTSRHFKKRQTLKNVHDLDLSLKKGKEEADDVLINVLLKDDKAHNHCKMAGDVQHKLQEEELPESDNSSETQSSIGTPTSSASSSHFDASKLLQEMSLSTSLSDSLEEKVDARTFKTSQITLIETSM